MICYNHKLSDEYIQTILATRGRFGIPEGEYKERHHIIPECLGGKTVEDNLIDLYAREHYEVHRLLALENPTMNCLVQAWWLMAFMKNPNQTSRYFITAEEYEEIKVFYSEHQSIRFSGEGNPMYGKNAFANKTPEEMLIIAEKKSKALKGKKRTAETRHNLSLSKLGDKNPMKGLTGAKHPNAKPCMCIETGETFVTGLEAANWLGGLPEYSNASIGARKGGVCSSCKTGKPYRKYTFIYI